MTEGSWLNGRDQDDGDMPNDYEVIGKATDPATELWNVLSEDDDAMEDYIWSRDYIDAMNDFGHIITTPQQLVEEWTG